MPSRSMTKVVYRIDHDVREVYPSEEGEVLHGVSVEEVDDRDA